MATKRSSKVCRYDLFHEYFCRYPTLATKPLLICTASLFMPAVTCGTHPAKTPSKASLFTFLLIPDIIFAKKLGRVTAYERLDLLFEQNNDILKTAQVLENGITKSTFYAYAKQRGVDKWRRGKPPTNQNLQCEGAWK